MRAFKGVVSVMVCVLGVAGGAMVANLSGMRVASAAEKAPLTAEQRQMEKDYIHAHVYIREFQKAPDRVWLYPVQLAAMMRYGPDVLKWADACDKRWTSTEASNPESYPAEVRLRGLVYQVRAHTQTYLAMKGDIAKELPGKLEAAIKAADADTQKGADSGLTGDFDKGRKSLEKAEDIYVLAQAVYGAEDPALKKAGEDVKALDARVGERQKVYWEKTREKAKRPEEGYRSSDLEKVRSAVVEAWKAKYPADKGVTVIVPSNLNVRLTVASFNEKEGTLELEDISLLPVRVVVEGEAGYEWVYTAMAVKTGPTKAPVISADVSRKDLLTSPRDLVKKK